MTIETLNEEQYLHNLELFSQADALTAKKIGLREFHHIHFCKTEKNELNLYRQRYGLTDYYHAQTGALEEAQQALTKEHLKNNQVFYFYGLGLAYIYDALKPWLEEDSSRHLVFLEDDLEVFHCFFHDKRATAILQDPQATLFYFEDVEVDSLKFYKLHSRFLNQDVYFLNLPYYSLRRIEKALLLCYYVLHDHSMMAFMCNEYLTGQSGFLSNFYRNLLHAPDFHLGSQLFGKFKGVPAIICGAGPSLEKNIETLKTLTDRALIFAGGSSLNVLNHYGLVPHFGLGIDPNPEQLHRLLSNDTFHLPFLFRARLAHRAFEMIEGPKVYVPGSIHPLPAWFEKAFGLDSCKIDEGHNVVNFCTEIAHLFGCDPIIYVGMDLAFTEVKTYAPGIKTHPLWVETSHPYQSGGDQLIFMKDIAGEAIKTKWAWIAEAEWLSHYARKHPSVKTINATEGGLGFASIPNQPLKEAADEYLRQDYDIAGLTHAEIQNSPFEIRRGDILKLMMTFKNSLDRCIEHCRQIQEERESNPTKQESPKEILNETLLQEEIAYQHFLKIFDQIYSYLKDNSSLQKNFNQLPFPLRHYQFLKKVLEQHAGLLTHAAQEIIMFPPPFIERIAPPFSYSNKDVYQFDGKKLIIHDEELDLHIEEPFEPSQEECIKKIDDHGVLRQEAYYREKKLHGPSRFYSKEGVLLADTWFIKGKREGKNHLFYPSGVLYGIQRYQHHLFHGLQEYFFENGEAHLIISYEKGVLHGDVLIYNADGKIIRELHYKQGKRHGIERMWNKEGILLMDCYYDNGTPTGINRQWTSKGFLFKKLTVRQFPDDFDLEIFDEKEHVVQRFIHGIEDFSDYYQEKQQQAMFIDQAINSIMAHIDPIVQTRLSDQQAEGKESTLLEDFNRIKEDVQKLQQLKLELDDTLKTNLEKAEQARDQRRKWENDS